MSSEMKFVFVVLHYSAVHDTIECLNSLLSNVQYSNSEIVVVDNCCPDDGIVKLKNEFDKEKKIHFLQTDKNIGFAKGNNVGYQYAKKVLNADFIILLNNDTIVEQDNFLLKISEVYEKDCFAILGPDILSTEDGEHQNPYTKVDLQEIRINILFYRLCLALTHLNLYDPITKSILFLSKALRGKQSADNNEFWKEPNENVKLQGSCLIFSPLYVKKYRGLFDKTFMYVEEDILYYIARKENLKMVYSPEVRILHKEKSSTKSMNKTSREMKLFYYSNMCKSLKVFLELTKHYQEEHQALMDD
jgi:GT2 family glycosyltransferase